MVVIFQNESEQLILIICKKIHLIIFNILIPVASAAAVL